MQNNIDVQNYNNNESLEGIDQLSLCLNSLEEIQGQFQEMGYPKDQRLNSIKAVRNLMDGTMLWLQQFHRSDAISFLNIGLNIAEQLSDWPLVITLRDRLTPLLQDKRVIAENYIKLSLAHLQQGQIFLSISKLRQALLLSTNDAEIFELWKELNQQVVRPEVTQLANQNLVLCPLSAYHLEDFIWQYDERVQTLCNLPAFNTKEEWQHWLSAIDREPNLDQFAICHQEWGFIGSVSLKVHEGIGFFYYWLGNDFQGMGLGPEAVRVLLDYGYRYKGMHCCYAKIYDDNHPSHKAIAKLGFKAISLKGLPPHDNEVYYHLGPDKSQQQIFNEVDLLLKSMYSEIVLEPKIQLDY